MTIQSFDKPTLNILRAKLAAALKEVADSTGLKIEVGSCRFNSNIASFKLEVATVGQNGQVNSREAEAFKREAHFFGLQPTDLGRSFRSGGHTYKITGLKPNSPRFPVLATRMDGKGFKFPSDSVKAFLASSISSI